MSLPVSDILGVKLTLGLDGFMVLMFQSIVSDWKDVSLSGWEVLCIVGTRVEISLRPCIGAS